MMPAQAALLILLSSELDIFSNSYRIRSEIGLSRGNIKMLSSVCFFRENILRPTVEFYSPLLFMRISRYNRLMRFGFIEAETLLFLF